jgi:DNA-binding PadR family transcriptional regulator
MLGEKELIILLETLQTEHPKGATLYKTTELIQGDYEHSYRVIQGLERQGWVDKIFCNDERLIKVTDKGLNFINKKEDVVDKMGEEKTSLQKIRKNSKTTLQEIREERIKGILKKHGELDKKELRKYLKKFEDLTEDSVYQALRPMVTDGSVMVNQVKRKNYYSLPELKNKPSEVENLKQKYGMKDSDIQIDHTGSRTVNNTEKEIAAAKPKPEREQTIGELVNQLLPSCDSIKIQNSKGAINELRFNLKSKKDFISAIKNLPEPLIQESSFNADPDRAHYIIFIPTEKVGAC